MSLRSRPAAVAILKPRVWHPLAKHGAPARRILNISEIKMVGFIAKPTIFVSLRGAQRRGNLKVIDVESRSEARERKTTESPNFESTRSDATTALLRKRHFTRANALHFPCAASFTRSKIVFHRAATLGRRPNFAAQHWPCLVPGCRLVPSKIAASGIENALLAMTESVGFSEKRDSFQNEMFEKRCSAAPRKNDRIQQKASVFQTKPSPFRVIARSAASWQS